MTPEHRRATHPGVLLLGEMIERDLKPSVFAKECGLTVGEVEELFRGDAVTPDIADRLANGLGTSKELWLNLQAAYDRSGP